MLAAFIGVASSSPLASAADDDKDESSSPRPTAVASAVEDGAGIIGNVGFLGLKTLGREDSIVPVEVLPYFLLDENFLFSDIRGFVSTEGQFGGNFGVGYRRLVPNQNAWYGVNAWYDVDDTSTQLYHQLGLGLEAAFQYVELRSNGYLPVGDTEQTLVDQAAQARFNGNGILFNQQVINGKALPGFDSEIGIVLPVEAIDDTTLRWFAGGYYFFSDDQGQNVTGFQTRVEAQIATTVTTQVQFTTDDVYGSNVMVGVSLDFPWGEKHPTSNWRRGTPSPFRFVHRNYNVILDRRDASTNNVVAINPRTGQPYEVAHVDTSAAANGTGTPDSPYRTYAAAQVGNPDLIFVHAGSVLSEAMQVASETRLLGDVGTHWISLPNSQSAPLPTLNTTNAATPRITGVTGTAVMLGSNSEASGFTIDHITGNGIVVDGATNATIQNVNLSDVSGDAIRITNGSGSFLLQDIAANRIGGRGLLVSGGNLNLSTNASFTQITGDAVRLDDLTDGSITLNGVTISDSQARGLVLDDVDADVAAVELSVSDTTGQGVDITAGTGTFIFGGLTEIEGTGGGFRVDHSDARVTIETLSVTTNSGSPALTVDTATEQFHVGLLSITNTNGPGVVARDAELLTIDNGSVTTTNGAAFDAEDSELDVKLAAITVDGGNFGLRLVNTTGGFADRGDHASLSGGEIKNTTTGIVLDHAGSVALTNLKLTNNQTGVLSRSSGYLLIDRATVTGSTGYALDSTNDLLLSVRNSVFTNNGAIGGGTIRVRADAIETYRSEFVTNAINDTKGTPILFATANGGTAASLSTTLTGNTIIASRGGESGVKVLWNGPAAISAFGNTFQLSGASMTGIDLQAQSTTDSITATIGNNTMAFSGGNGVGVNVLAMDESSLQVYGSSIIFTGAGGTGLRFDLRGTSTSWFYSNSIIDQGSSGTGILFANVGASSRVQLDGNVIDLQSASASVDRGIIFNGITDTIQLYGTTNNVVNNASDPLFIPAGKTTGSFYLNGVLVP